MSLIPYFVASRYAISPIGDYVVLDMQMSATVDAKEVSEFQFPDEGNGGAYNRILMRL